MSRQAQVNSFNDGLNKDLNPLLTPNTVMTDCLNGTIVTYNGNEFALQNDLGNYKFKYGSLSEGFVPVGIKEHANTLYIISYNPVEDLVEVGSFPSMKTIFKSDINTHGEKDSTVIELKEEWNNYSEIQSFSQLTMLSSFDEDYKLNPGDGYRLECGDKKENEDESDVARMLELDKQSKWQHTGVFVMTENQKLYNIDAFVQLDVAHDTYTTDDWRSVKWDVPGWLALKVIPNVMSEFNCYITDLDYIPENDYIKTEATIKVQSIWDSNMYNRDFLIGKTSTGYYRRIIDYIRDHIGYIVKYNKKEYIHLPNAKDHGSKFNDIENNLTVYNDIYSTIHTNIQIETKEDTQVEITPFLYICTDEDDINNDKKIVYDQFKTVLSLEKREFNSKDVKFGENVFKYYIGKSELTMNFDVVAPIGSILEYNLRRYPASGDMVEVYPEFKKIQDLNYNGQNIITFKFSNDYSDRYDKFDKEDYYELDVYIHPENYIIKNSDKNSKDGSKLCFKTSKAVYASEVVNYYQKQYDNYDSDEFKLDAESFADAAQRVLVVNNPIKQLYDGFEDVYIDYQGNRKKTSDGLIDGFFDELLKSPYSTSQNDYNKTASVGYGIRYNWVKPNVVFDLPKDQSGEKIGRMWLGFSTDSAEKKIIATTASNNTFDVIDSGDHYSIDLISKAIVKLGVNNISISYPTENQSNTMYNMANSFVSKIGGNKYKLKNLAYYEKNDKDNDDIYSCSKIKPVDDITFEVIDSTHININGISHELVNNDWVYSSKIYDDVYQSIPKFEMDGDWWVDDKSHTVVSDGLNKNIKTPVLVVYNYNNEVGHSDERFFWGDEQWLGVEFGFKYPKLFATRNTTGKVFYIAIGIPRNSADTEKLFYTLMRSRKSTIAENGYQVFINTLCDYFLMVDSIKYCKSTSSQNYYYPIASVSESVVRSSIIKEIDYFISGIKYKYKYSGDNDNINSMVSELGKIIYSYNENVNIKLSNNANSIAAQIEESALDFNSKIDFATENIREFSSVNSREIYIDQRHRTNDSWSPVNVMFNALTWDSGKFTINEISPDGGLHMRRDISNKDDAGYVVSRIYNSTIYEL